MAVRDQDKTVRRNGSSGSGPAAGHHALVAQPHTDAEGPVADAEALAARISTEQHPLGRPGRPFNSRSPFLIGISAAAGVAVTVGLVEMIVTVRDVLVLIGLALFLAVGLEPAVSFLARHKFPRWAAVLTVMMAGLAVVGGFLTAAIPPLTRQTTLIDHCFNAEVGQEFNAASARWAIVAVIVSLPVTGVGPQLV